MTALNGGSYHNPWARHPARVEQRHEPEPPRRRDVRELPASGKLRIGRVVSLADVQPERVGWAWLHRLPWGKLTVYDGDPGLGKSTTAADLAARISTGAPMPESELERKAAGVVILSAEDGLGDTIRPRLDAARADLSRIVALTAVLTEDGERLPALPIDLDQLEQAAFDVAARLIVIDPLPDPLVEDDPRQRHRAGSLGSSGRAP